MRTVIAFDVSDDRTRRRVAQAIGGYATRVQRSVFEAADLSDQAYAALRKALEELVDSTTDSLRYYRVCSACEQRIEHIGPGCGQIAPPGTFVLVPEGS